MTARDTEKLVELGLIAVGLYLGYKVLTGVGNAVNSAETAGSNFDQNVGLGPFDTWVSSLFDPPASTP